MRWLGVESILRASLIKLDVTLTLVIFFFFFGRFLDVFGNMLNE